MSPQTSPNSTRKRRLSNALKLDMLIKQEDPISRQVTPPPQRLPSAPRQSLLFSPLYVQDARRQSTNTVLSLLDAHSTPLAHYAPPSTPPKASQLREHVKKLSSPFRNSSVEKRPQKSSPGSSGPVTPSAPKNVRCLTPNSSTYRERNPRMIDLTWRTSSADPDIELDPFAADPINITPKHGSPTLGPAFELNARTPPRAPPSPARLLDFPRSRWSSSSESDSSHQPPADSPELYASSPTLGYFHEVPLRSESEPDIFSPDFPAPVGTSRLGHAALAHTDVVREEPLWSAAGESHERHKRPPIRRAATSPGLVWSQSPSMDCTLGHASRATVEIETYDADIEDEHLSSSYSDDGGQIKGNFEPFAPTATSEQSKVAALSSQSKGPPPYYAASQQPAQSASSLESMFTARETADSQSIAATDPEVESEPSSQTTPLARASRDLDNDTGYVYVSSNVPPTVDLPFDLDDGRLSVPSSFLYSRASEEHKQDRDPRRTHAKFASASFPSLTTMQTLCSELLQLQEAERMQGLIRSPSPIGLPRASRRSGRPRSRSFSALLTLKQADRAPDASRANRKKSLSDLLTAAKNVFKL